jgi:hypothetical protein
VEALAVELLVAEGQVAEALTQFESAVTVAESSDLYTAAWLTATCSRTLLTLAPQRMRTWIERFKSPIEEFGYAGIAKGFNKLVGG